MQRGTRDIIMEGAEGDGEEGKKKRGGGNELKRRVCNKRRLGEGRWEGRGGKRREWGGREGRGGERGEGGGKGGGSRISFFTS